MAALIRASYLQGNLTGVGALGADVLTQVRSKLGAETLARIEGANRLEWLPMALDVELTHAVFAVAGNAGVRRYNREGFKKSFEGPLLAPILGAATRLFGLSPHGLSKAIPAAFSAATRGFGVLVSEKVDARTLAMEQRDIPADLAGDDVYFDGFIGVLEGTLDVTRRTGSAREDAPPAPTTRKWTVTWQA
jgi:hypothetical protein